MRRRHAKDSFADVAAACGGIAELLPVLKPTASDYIVYCGKCPAGMIQVAMQHAIPDYSRGSDFLLGVLWKHERLEAQMRNGE